MNGLQINLEQLEEEENVEDHQLTTQGENHHPLLGKLHEAEVGGVEVLRLWWVYLIC